MPIILGHHGGPCLLLPSKMGASSVLSVRSFPFIQQEGLRVLWRGTPQSLMMSIPMVGIYMPLYDQMYQQWHPTLGWYSALAAGSLSRMIAVVCVAPFELLRTQLQVRCVRTPVLEGPSRLACLCCNGGCRQAFWQRRWCHAHTP